MRLGQYYIHHRHLLKLLLLCGVLFSVPLIVFGSSEIDGFIYDITTGLGNKILWLAGGLFDYAVIELVIKMGSYLQTGADGSGIGDTIEALWIIVRDTFNLLFIFGVIYIGFRVILFSEDADVHKTLGWLIVAALMVNFSLYITEIVVDFSNATAYQIYESMVSNDMIDSSLNKVTSTEIETKTIASTFMNIMNLTTYASEESLKDLGHTASFGMKVSYGFLMMFLMLIAAFVFAAGAFMLLGRFVALIIFMILSPAMFVGMVFPYFQQYQKMWWQKFLQYSFVAPAYMFMIYLSIRTLLAIMPDDKNSNFATAFRADSWAEGTFMIFLYFFIVAAFLIASVYIANLLGVYGAGASMNMLQGAGTGILNRSKLLAGGATFGLVGRGLRNTVGWQAQKYAESNTAKDRAKRSLLGKAVHKAAFSAGGASFDARQIGSVGKQYGIGEGAKGGYKAARDAIEKKESAYAKTLIVSDDDETVKNMDEEIKAHEAKLMEARKDKAAARTAETRAAAETEILKIEEELKQKRSELSREKHRNIIGSSADKERFEEAKKEQQKTEGLLEGARARKNELIQNIENLPADDFTNRRDLEERIRETDAYIKTQKKAVSEARKAARVAQSNMGYASTLQTSGFFSSAIMGRIIAQNQNAGGALEKEYLKKIKQTKEDERYQSMLATFKSSVKSD